MYEAFNDTRITIETVQPEDFQAIGEIHAQSLKELYQGHMPPNAIRKLKPDRIASDWRESVESGEEYIDFLVLKEKGQIVGFGVSLLETVNGAPEPKISECHIAEDRRGLGYGKKLLNQMLLSLSDQGYDSPILYVSTDNERAQDVYRQMGAVIESEESHNII